MWWLISIVIIWISMIVIIVNSDEPLITIVPLTVFIWAIWLLTYLLVGMSIKRNITEIPVWKKIEYVENKELIIQKNDYVLKYDGTIHIVSKNDLQTIYDKDSTYLEEVQIIQIYDETSKKFFMINPAIDTNIIFHKYILHKKI